MNFCRYCGSKLEENAKFCTKCGKAIQSNTISNYDNVGNNQTQVVNYQNCSTSEETNGGTGIVVAAICLFFGSYFVIGILPLFFLIRFVLLILLVTGFIMYPKNTVIKIFFWGYLVAFILSVIFVVLTLMACNNFLEGCDEAFG